MAEQVQSILEQMVPHLKDLQDRSIFTPTEITSIVERRRKSEYLLHRRNSARKSDYLRYIEDEIMLEKLRKLRKEKVLLELKAEREARYNNNNNSDDDDSDVNDGKQAAYKTSGSGDSHIIRHIHYIYQRTLRKFHYPLDILLNYANFAKDVKSFKHLSRIYAQGIQYHPREVGLWIEASSFEYFGYVAQDYENNSLSKKGDEVIDSKVVGSSISNARILMQRALRINKNSEELWNQYFSLELHYVQKLWGRQQVLEGGVDVTVGDLSGIGSDAEDEDEEEDEEKQEEEHAKWTQSLTTLLPSQIIYKNAIKALPDNIQFRLKFIETCRQFPNTEMLISYIMDSITRDFGSSVEGWVARISFVEEGMMNGEEGIEVGLLGMDNEEEEGGSDDDEEEGERPTKKARVEKEESNELVVAAAVSSGDAALDLLQEALEAVPTSKMYLEGARFLRLRIQRLVDNEEGDEGEDGEDVSYLFQADKDAEGAAQRHVQLLEQLYAQASEKNVTSVSLTLDRVDFLLSTDQLTKAETLLRDAATASSTSTTDDNNARLWLRWAEISSQMEAPSSSSTSILHRALKSTPIHNRHAHTLILTELMQHLMMKPTRSAKVDDELKTLFQKLILLSQGSDYSMPTKKGENADDDEAEEEDTVNVASTFLAYLKYTMDTKDDTAQGNKQEDATRSIYTSVLYHSNYGKSCSGKTGEELLTMKSFFDLCIEYEKTSRSGGSGNTKKNKKEKKKTRKMRLCKLYETGISFYESCGGGSSVWRNIVDGYTRELQDVKYSLRLID